MLEITYKTCLLGDFSVGKTSLIKRFVENKFSDEYLSTIGVKISRKSLAIKTDIRESKVNLLLWDLEGKTKFKSITPSYLKGAKGGIIVGDLTRSDTVKNIHKHIKLFLEINQEGVIIVALNKADLIPEEKLAKMIQSYSFNSYERVIETYITSAKTGDQVSSLFEQLSSRLITL